MQLYMLLVLYTTVKNYIYNKKYLHNQYSFPSLW